MKLILEFNAPLCQVKLNSIPNTLTLINYVESKFGEYGTFGPYVVAEDTEIRHLQLFHWSLYEANWTINLMTLVGPPKNSIK